MAAKDDAKLARARAALLDAAIENAAFDGFTPRAIDEAARSLKIAPDLAALAFPGGAKDLLRAWSEKLDDAVRAELEAADLSDLKIRARVTRGVRLRLEKMAPQKISARRAAAFLALPLNAPMGAELSFRTADAIWKGIGDTATDFNYYTKRLLLAGVVTSTMLYWFGDDSEDSQPTWDFLDRRIENVMSFEKAKASVQGVVAKLPNPFSLLGSLRYPSRGK
ncbi:MAG: COQ9 family protein [Micropepsaceae bacterium]